MRCGIRVAATRTERRGPWCVAALSRLGPNGKPALAPGQRRSGCLPGNPEQHRTAARAIGAQGYGVCLRSTVLLSHSRAHPEGNCPKGQAGAIRRASTDTTHAVSSSSRMELRQTLLSSDRTKKRSEEHTSELQSL